MPESPHISPKWNSTTKLVVGLTIVAVIAALLIQFHNIIGPLMLAFMLAYLLYPVIRWLSNRVKISWRLSVNLLYLLLIILVLATFTATGLAIVQQFESLIGFIQRNVTNLPALVADISRQVYKIGPLELNLARYDFQALVNQVLSWVQPILGRAGGLISTVATSAATTIAWGLFVLLISYFLLAETNRVSDELVHIELPGYNQDVRRLGAELGTIWNAFFRGQLIIIILVIIAYTLLMLIFGMRFALGIAILAGLGRLVPYIGPAILWIVTGLVAYFQGGNYFGLQPLAFAILVLAVAFLTDQIFDNLIAPRLLGQTLGVHPAAVLITAIIAARWIGLIGLLLAAPVVASIKLLTGYVIRKMFDLPAWSEAQMVPATPELPWIRLEHWIKERAKKRKKPIVK